ncbi:hypothetical protein CQW23_27006 [Capsicum baccatum]|uniref:Uncharacterized protein n=1 Tax=Capsicum baccatum TaxID=33114 RepID=A0A2G2VQG1_CAPBA|nr:hypothetical protein CQW23_27006 [Capsicum baccatum]
MDPMEHPELEKVAKQIAAKCKGLPLARKTLAGMLRSESEVEGWRRILRSELWDLSNNDILSALMLSNNELPPHLKPCFSYCAIFPKAYPFRKAQVIHLSISNGLVEQWGDERIQGLGNQYFNELRSRSLFERVRNPFHGNIEEFLMHDLVNDLALIASSKLCVRNRVLHNILPSLRSLRALPLSGYGIVEMPNDLFIRLKLLRFLDFSRTDTKKLPDSICALYNLETLLLSSCDDLEELPPQMEKLIKLRHLDISDTSHLKRPLHLSKLKSLQLLVGAEFLLGDPCGWRMEDLSDLHNLYGSLSILELQNLVDKREAPKAKMREKEHVEKLSLRWSGSIADNSQTERHT